MIPDFVILSFLMLNDMVEVFFAFINFFAKYLVLDLFIKNEF